MKSNTDYLFVYGTLGKSLDHPKSRIINKHGTYIGKGFFQGRMYQVASYPGVVSSSNSDDRVTGDLYSLEDPSSVFDELDPYEGYNTSDPGRSLFIREEHPVQLEYNNESVKAWIYLFNRPITGLKEIPSGDYLTFLDED